MDKRTIDFDSATLFYRLIIFVERSPDTQSYFHYELATTPCFIFSGYLTNKAGTAALGKILKVAVEYSKTAVTEICVTEGGALLHHVKWTHNVPLSAIVSQYVTLVKS